MKYGSYISLSLIPAYLYTVHVCKAGSPTTGIVIEARVFLVDYNGDNVI